MENIEPLVRAKMPFVAPDDRLARIAQVLARTRANAALVAEGSRLIGCVMRKLLLRPPLSPETKAERLATHVPCGQPGTAIENAIAMMLQSGCDLLPVVEGDKLVGAAFARDLALRDPAFGALLVRDASDHLAPPLRVDSSVSEAARCLREMDMESLPLVDTKGAFSGWISFPDVQRYLVAPTRALRRTGELVGEKDRPLRNPIGPLANRSNLAIGAESNLHDAILRLCRKQLNEITVLDRGTVLGHLSIIRILGLKMPTPDLMVQTAGLEEEDPLPVSQVIGNLRSTALKIRKICRNMGTPEIKVKSYMHAGSGRKRYEVRVSFSVPERYVAEAQGWDLAATSSKAIGKVEKEVLRGRSRVIDSHRRRRARAIQGVD